MTTSAVALHQAPRRNLLTGGLEAIRSAFDVFFAAVRVSAAVENRRAPRKADLVVLGLADIPAVAQLAARG